MRVIIKTRAYSPLLTRAGFRKKAIIKSVRLFLIVVRSEFLSNVQANVYIIKYTKGKNSKFSIILSANKVSSTANTI